MASISVNESCSPLTGDTHVPLQEHILGLTRRALLVINAVSKVAASIRNSLAQNFAIASRWAGGGGGGRGGEAPIWKDRRCLWFCLGEKSRILVSLREFRTKRQYRNDSI